MERSRSFTEERKSPRASTVRPDIKPAKPVEPTKSFVYDPRGGQRRSAPVAASPPAPVPVRRYQTPMAPASPRARPSSSPASSISRPRSASPKPKTHLSESSLWELVKSLQEELVDSLNNQLEMKERETSFRKLQLVEETCSARRESLLARQLLAVCRRPARGFEDHL